MILQARHHKQERNVQLATPNPSPSLPFTGEGDSLVSAELPAHPISAASLVCVNYFLPLPETCPGENAFVWHSMKQSAKALVEMPQNSPFWQIIHLT